MKYTYEFLRKCHGLRFKAVRSGENIEGIVKVEKDGVVLCYGEETLDNFNYFHRRFFVQITPNYLFEGTSVSNFEIVPRDPDTYKDWQVGDKIIRNDRVNVVIFRCGEVVLYKDHNNRCSACPYTCEELSDRGYRLVLTDIEKQILEEWKKEEWEPRDGDIVSWGVKEVDKHPAITIYKAGHWGYFTLFTNGETTLNRENDGTLVFDNIRPATEGEKQQLFIVLAKAGKRWDAEKKCLEDIPEPHELMKGDLVLVRDAHYMGWKLRVFEGGSDAPELPYKATLDGFVHEYRYCIPYNEETKHLLGTADDYEEGE